MQLGTLLLFGATVMPIVVAPGPDILFITSNGIASGRSAALRGTAGELGGYTMHSVLGALGVAAAIAAIPVLFEGLRWFGVAYLFWLALQMLRSALKTGQLDVPASSTGHLLRRGFLTSFLNPKGLLVYLGILPNFIQPGAQVAVQSLTLSSIYVGSCAVFYTLVALVSARIGQAGQLNERKRRIGEGAAGGLLLLAASRLAMS